LLDEARPQLSRRKHVIELHGIGGLIVGGAGGLEAGAGVPGRAGRGLASSGAAFLNGRLDLTRGRGDQ